MTIYIDDNKIKEANERCNKAINDLKNIAIKYLSSGDSTEYRRIMEKIQGVHLAQDFFNQCLKDN